MRGFSRLRQIARYLPLVAVATACHGLLDVSDPTLVRDSDIANASGANARRLNVAQYLNANAPSLAVDVARITDEWINDGPLGRIDPLDRRDGAGYVKSINTQDVHIGLWDQMYWQTSIAIPAVRAYTPDSLQGDFLGHLYGIRGYAALQLAEDICSGFPLNDVAPDNQPLFGGPLTTDSALIIANMELDSAIKYAHDSTRFVTLARVAKGRALLDQGKYAEAAAAVTTVATTDVYQTDGPGNAMANTLRPGTWSRGGINFAAGDNEGGNGMPFVSAHDPRVPVVLGGARAINTLDTLYKSSKYANTTPMVLAGGVEARLIEAEAALHAGDPNWLTILNTLRATAISPAMSALVMPSTAAAQVDLLYRERAFWLYSTGRRLGDLRRLIKNYGRNPETVFPSGPFYQGGTYGTATAIPFSLSVQQSSNPHITAGCTTP